MQITQQLSVDQLQAMTGFAKVVELGSFARAAERLGVSTSAVSRQVADLEAHLDTRLLNRTTRRLSLTEAGQVYYERCVQLLAELDEAEAQVRSASVAPQGTLRVTCGVSFGVRYLAPLIAEFAARHPAVSFDLDLSDRIVDMVEEGYDLAVRIGSSRAQSLVSRRIGSTRMVCCAAPSYLQRRGMPHALADLAAHDCLAYSYVADSDTWRFEKDGDDSEVKVPVRHRANNGRMLAALAVEGAGIVYEPDFIVAPDIRAGRLLRLLPEYRGPVAAISALYPSRRHLSAKVRAFVDFLAARSAADPPWSLD
ncbi:MAG: LysR family transcriptional regulator [Steroidobacteraceae bacterium]